MGEDEEAPVTTSSLVIVKFTSAVIVVADMGAVSGFANRMLVQFPSLPGRQLSHILLAFCTSTVPTGTSSAAPATDHSRPGSSNYQIWRPCVHAV